MASYTASGFQLGALPQAPRINPQDFQGAPQAFQQGLADQIKIRAAQLELADQQRRGDIAQATQDQRLRIEQANLGVQEQNIPLLGQAQAVQAQQTIDTAPALTESAIAQAKTNTITAQNRAQFLQENGQFMNQVERAKLEHELQDAEFDGDAVVLQEDSSGLIKRAYRVSRKDPTKRRLVGEIMMKTPEQVARDNTAFETSQAEAKSRMEWNERRGQGSGRVVVVKSREQIPADPNVFGSKPTYRDVISVYSPTGKLISSMTPEQALMNGIQDVDEDRTAGEGQPAQSAQPKAAAPQFLIDPDSDTGKKMVSRLLSFRSAPNLQEIKAQFDKRMGAGAADYILSTAK